jgi:hypothetical protein
MRRLCGVGLAAAIALGVGGCGAPPPQAPPSQANRLSDALSSIAQDCGEAYQQRAFAATSDLSSLEADAISRGRELAGVFHANRAWVYQGDTVLQIVALSVGYLRECHLDRAAGDLVRATR